MDDSLGEHRDPGPAAVKTGGGLGTDGGNLYPMTGPSRHADRDYSGNREEYPPRVRAGIPQQRPFAQFRFPQMAAEQASGFSRQDCQ